MTWLEVLLLIFVIVETIQVFFLLQTNRKTKQLIEDVIKNPEYAAEVAENFVFGLMDRIGKDKESQQIFFGFCNTIGLNILAALREKAGGGTGKPVKTGVKLLDGIFNIPGVGDALGSMIQSKATAGAKKAVDTAIDPLFG